MLDRDKTTIAAGKAAWVRIKTSNSFEDWLAIDDAPLVGRQLMKNVGADKPRGVKYVKANAAWLKETGFGEISKGARATAMLCAENIKGSGPCGARAGPQSSFRRRGQNGATGCASMKRRRCRCAR